MRRYPNAIISSKRFTAGCAGVAAATAESLKWRQKSQIEYAYINFMALQLTQAGSLNTLRTPPRSSGTDDETKVSPEEYQTK